MTQTGLRLAADVLPNEIWLHIIGLSASIDTIRNITLMKPDLFRLFIHEFDNTVDSIDLLYFKDLASYQLSTLNNTSVKDTVYLHEVCQRKPSDTYSRENHGVYRYSPDDVCTINNRDFQNCYHDEEQLSSPLYYAFNIKGCLSVSNSVERKDNNGSYRFLWNVKFPELFTFPELSNLMLYNEILQPSNVYDISRNLNSDVFPKLKYLQINSISRDSPVWLTDCHLPSLETLSIRWGILTNFVNVQVPNLKELELAMISSPATDFVDDANKYYNVPFVEIDNERSLEEQLQNGLIRYENPSFDSNSKFDQLTKFQLLAFDTFKSSLDPYFLYFIDNISTFEHMENIRIDMGHLYEQTAFSDQKNRTIRTITEITRWKLVKKINDSIKSGKSNLKKLHIHAPFTSQFLSDDLVTQFDEFTNIEDLSLLNLHLSKESTLDKLKSLRNVYLKLKSLSKFIHFKSTKLQSFILEIDTMATSISYQKELQDDLTLSQYLQSFEKDLPNLTRLDLQFGYNFKDPLASDRVTNLPRYDLFYNPLNLPSLTSLTLYLSFNQLLQFFEKSNRLSFPNLRCFVLECELRSCHDLADPHTDTLSLLNTLDPAVKIRAPLLKKLILNITNQCDLHPEYDALIQTIESRLQTIKIDYYPSLYKICYNRDEDMIFRKLKLEDRNRDVIVKGSEYDEGEYYEGEELAINDEEFDSEWEDSDEEEGITLTVDYYYLV